MPLQLLIALCNIVILLAIAGAGAAVFCALTRRGWWA